MVTGGPVFAAPEPVPAGADLLIDLWEPGAVPGLDVLGVSSSAVPPHLRPVAGLTFGLVGSPLITRRQVDGENDGGPVSDRMRLDVTAGIGLFDRFAVSLQLPLILSQAGDNSPLTGTEGALPGAGLGDLRLSVRGLLLSGAGFGLAAALDVHAPTGMSRAWATTGGFRLTPGLIADWYAPSGLGVVVNLGWRLVPETRAYNLVADDSFVWALGLVMPTPADRLEGRATLSGAVSIASSVDPNAPASELPGPTDPVELVFALGLGLGPRLMGQGANLWPIRVELGGGAGLSRGLGSPEWRAFLSVTWSPRDLLPRDVDGDGLEDAADSCPEAAEDFDGFEDTDGCPDLDNDGDGVADVHDGGADASGFGRCRMEPEDNDGYEDADGCPDADNDGDGVLDVADGPVDDVGFGVCRDQAEDKDGFNDEDGCLDADNDGDGVPDIRDGAADGTGFGRCRDLAETDNGYRDDDGCPDVEPRLVRVESARVALLEKVFFEPNRSPVKPQSEGLLIELAQVLNEQPEITKIRIEVHTDVLGDPGHNDRLSQARAASIVDFLVARGVDKSRLEGEGLGSRRPLIEGPPARVEPGLSLNRRVEVHIVERTLPQ